jgi:hypothetical protein
LSGIPYALLIGAETLTTDEALLHDVQQGTEVRLPLLEVVSRVDAVLKRMP